ncbi:hypothetical protein [Geodermatophilus normandii]|uniref:hypothetical protein n=1 Tax=Geodermatophilus normandii TaxID=1137989 RepID=UPI0011B517AF|nr:hypothetical protein [Geodermatophilus normandii]
MYVVRGLLQAAVMLVVGAVLAAAAAGVWVAVADGDFGSRLGISMVVVAGLIGLLGGTAVARAETSDVRAFLGMGPEREQPELNGALGPVGVFLFVALPLAAVGLVLVG